LNRRLDSEAATMFDAVPVNSTSPHSDPISEPDAATLFDIPAVPSSGYKPLISSPAIRPRPASHSFSIPTLPQGTLLGGRYEIEKPLGEGGMGAVYKAKDLELERLVAIKVIRPELAGNPDILQRFKQEILLASKVTHRNVIRIYDLGEADGIKFITMEYLEGEDLRSLLYQHDKLSVEESGSIIEQTLSGLSVAHQQGIIHRDLKPGNIMLEASGRVVVMDFGLARTMGGDGMTRSGLMVGTMEYMSPEQAQARDLDARSDVFTVGLIWYELLTGKMPYRADSAIASLLKRTQERAIPVLELEPSIPKVISDIVSRCLERDPALRYQNAEDMLLDIRAWRGNRTVAASMVMDRLLPKPAFPWKWVAAGLTALVLIGGAVWVSTRNSTDSGGSAGAVRGPVTSLAILPFHNASGDDTLSWLGPSLGDMLSTDVGQSAHLRTISPDHLQQILHDLRIEPGTAIDPTTLRRIAEFANADIVVSGQFVRLGDQIRIDAVVQDLKRGRSAPLKTEAQNQQDISAAVDRLADSIRQNLSLSSDLVKELRAQSFKPTSTSVDALRAYNEGVQLQRAGNNLEALKRFQSATTSDPQFALAFSRLAEIDAALGFESDAERASQRALDASQDLPLSAQYLIQASHARIAKDSTKAIAAYQNLEKSFPDDLDVQFALGSLYEESGKLDEARTRFNNVLKIDSKNLDALLAAGRIEDKAGNPQAALDPLSKARNIAIDLNNEEQQALILLATGIAYQDMNKPQEALRNFQDSMDINQRLGKKRGVAAAQVQIAQVQISLGKSDEALRSYNQALQLRREIGAKKEVGDSLIDIGGLNLDRGQFGLALSMFKEALQIQRDAGDETYQALCLNAIGNVYLARGESEDALTYFQQALQLREKLNVPGDIADTLGNIGVTNVNLGQYDQATDAYMRALDLFRKSGDTHGAALQSHSLGMMFQTQGRIGPAIGSLQDAVKGLRDAGDHGQPLAQAENDLAGALARGGRGNESTQLLEEAQTIARGLKSDPLNNALLNTDGDVRLYRGDLPGAHAAYQQALAQLSRTSDADSQLTTKLNLAHVNMEEGRGHAAIGELRSLAQQAEAMGRKSLTVQASAWMAEAMLKDKDYRSAREELERILPRSEKLGLRLQSAKIHYLLGTAMRLSGSNAESSTQYKAALSLLRDIEKEAGAEHIAERFDLKPVFEEASRWSKSS
jgi:eukaryotic-like serine/threonine-protein kinase